MSANLQKTDPWIAVRKEDPTVHNHRARGIRIEVSVGTFFSTQLSQFLSTHRHLYPTRKVAYWALRQRGYEWDLWRAKCFMACVVELIIVLLQLCESLSRRNSPWLPTTEQRKCFVASFRGCSWFLPLLLSSLGRWGRSSKSCLLASA